MAWVTWRQHRLQLLTMLLLLVGLAATGLVSSLPIRDAYSRQALASCLPPAARSGCDLIVSHFRVEFGGSIRAARYLTFLPVLAGLFVGAPLLARELEHGTHRLAWTQSLTRRRWLLSKTLLLGLATVAGGLALSGLAMWWRGPFDAVEGRISPSGFDIEGLVVPAYALFALSVGILAGVVLRRTIPAMSVTLAVFIATRLGIDNFARPHYLPAKHETVTGAAAQAHARDWVVDNTLVDAVGRRITTAREDLAILHAQQARIDPQDYLLSLGWRRAISFQPAERFWTFQAIEAGIFLALAALTVAATLWALRRTPS
jgi:ABC-2 family transporter